MKNFKKVLLIVSFLTLVGGTCYGVGKYPTKPLNFDNDVFKIVASDLNKGKKLLGVGENYCFVVDTKTDNIYYMISGYHLLSMTPYYNTKGEIMKYPEFLEVYNMKVK